MHVSFRNRLTFFFIVLVILPVLAVAAVGILLVRDSENTKNAGSLNRAQLAAEGLYTDARDRAMAVARTVQTDDRLAEAVRDGDRAAQQDRLEALTERTGAVRVRLVLEGQEPVEAGEGEAIAPCAAAWSTRTASRRASSTSPSRARTTSRACSSASPASTSCWPGRGVRGRQPRGRARRPPARRRRRDQRRGVPGDGLRDRGLRPRQPPRHPRPDARQRAPGLGLGEHARDLPHPDRLPGLRTRLRAHRRALARAARPPSSWTPRSRSAPATSRSTCPTEGNDEFASARRGVQRDGRPAPGPRGGAEHRRPARRGSPSAAGSTAPRSWTVVVRTAVENHPRPAAAGS